VAQSQLTAVLTSWAQAIHPPQPRPKKLCTIILPFGKFEYQKLPMGLCSSSDIFQEKMSDLMYDLEFVRAYLDDLLLISKGSYEDHLEKLDEVLKRLHDAGLQANIRKSRFAQSELEYLGYWITRDGVQPMANKVEAIHNIATPTTKKQLRSFIGMVNYYRDMWIRRSENMAPLTALTSVNAKWEWTDVHQHAFENIKKHASRETLLAWPDFSKTFDVHTDASDSQLGAVISQEGKPIAFYSRKLNPAQTRYTTTERELLAIVETLKEFRNILLGQQIRVYTDHKNLTYQTFNTDRVLRWRLILEEYGPELIYIKGERNIVADALSRLEKIDRPVPTERDEFAEAYGLDKNALPEEAFPLRYKNIQQHQKQDSALLAMAQKSHHYQIKKFRGGGKTRELICYKDKIVIPSTLTHRIVDWYHLQLCHPGETRTEATIRQHYYWKDLRADVHARCNKCAICQTCKRSHQKYGKLPPKDDPDEMKPWEKLCVDLIGPYKIYRKGKTTLSLWCVTMIDPATGWFEMKEIKTKSADVVSNVVDQTWLTRYPYPTILTYDRGPEFMAEFAKMITEDYGIKRKGITTRNPQANAIIERVHQTLGNIIRTFDYDDLDMDDPWSGILSATMFAIRSTYHTTLQATPSQLVFGRDAILNTVFEADWNHIRQRRRKLILKNNANENRTRREYDYSVRDKVLIKDAESTKYSKPPWQGPYVITQVNDNGTVRIRKGSVTDTVNIRQIKPFHE